MKITLIVFAMALIGSLGWADETTTQAKFAEPVRIKAGDAFAGDKRLYPSPVLFDLNGDKKLDLVVADLFGRVTVAYADEKGFAAKSNVLKSDGKPLKFHNW
ncbi:MAG: hypothetical protein ACYS0E_00160 [Planctomycetota bacterium]|jgi:hypothetical protein